MKKYLLVATIFLCSCATPGGNSPSYNEASVATPGEGEAVVVVYREVVPPLAYSVKVLIDGEKVASLPNNAYTWFYVSAGRHQITIDWPILALMPDRKVQLDAEPNRIHYVEFSGDVGVIPLGTATQFSFSSSTDEISEAVAVERLKKCCRYVPAEI